jgi:hypothetical protein
MVLRSIANRVVKVTGNLTRPLSDASKLCFGAAAGCFVVGAAGWIVNFLEPGITLLHGLLVVAVFYFALGVSKLFEKQAGDSHELGPVRDITGPLPTLEEDELRKVKQHKTAA